MVESGSTACNSGNFDQSNGKFVFWGGNGKIVPSLLYEFFEKKGIGKYFADNTKRKNTQPIIVEINGNVVAEVNDTYVMETAKNYVHECLDENGEAGPVLDSLLKSTPLFGDKTLKFLPTFQLEFISDSRNAAYFFFKNGVVKITAEGVSLHGYDEFDQFVWENNIIGIEYAPLSLETANQGDFAQFLKDITKVGNEGHSIARLNSLQSAVGYLLHRFKDGTTTSAIILMDVYVNGMPNGGSGKTLLIQAVGKVRNLSLIDGKKYDQREWFAFSSVGHDCEVLLFDDVEKNFNFELIFPLLTTGLYKRVKFKNHEFIPHEKSPKVAITTNYAINGDSSSNRRRKFEFEISATYSADFSPRDRFGRTFFDDWSDVNWNCFYNTMIRCVQLYLKNGLMQSDPINLKLTKLITSTSEEFVDFAKTKIICNEQLNKKQLYDEFLGEYQEYKYTLKQRTFTQWLIAWGEYKKYSFMEGHSGDTRYIIFSENVTP